MDIMIVLSIHYQYHDFTINFYNFHYFLNFFLEWESEIHQIVLFSAWFSCTWFVLGCFFGGFRVLKIWSWFSHLSQSIQTRSKVQVYHWQITVWFIWLATCSDSLTRLFFRLSYKVQLSKSKHWKQEKYTNQLSLKIITGCISDCAIRLHVRLCRL